MKSDWVNDWAMWAVGAVSASMVWIVRKIFTNEKQVELLARELEHSHAARAVAEEIKAKELAEIKKTQRQILQHVLETKKRVD